VKYPCSRLAIVLMAVCTASVAVAQNPNPGRAQQLRLQLEQRFAERVRTELALTAEQETKVRAIMGNYAQQRRDLEQGQRVLHQALAGQLRPGVAADADSVTMLVDRITASRVSYAEMFQAELKELATVLTPIQRGQLFLMRDQLFMRAQELRNQRMGGRPGGPPPMF
jgi:Spy/CpxP family protein refolding chaperone